MSSQMNGRDCPDERLIELVHGALGEDEASELEAHAASCASCGEELRLLSAESALFAVRAEETTRLPAGTFAKIAAQIAAQADVAARARRSHVRKRVAFGAAGLFAAAAAAAVVVLAGGGRSRTTIVSTMIRDAGVTAPAAASADGGGPAPVPGPSAHDSPRAVLALDSADRELDLAIAQLQQDYQRRRTKLPPARARRYDQEFGAALTAVDSAREKAGADVSARHQVMRARARYLRSMQTVVLREGRS